MKNKIKFTICILSLTFVLSIMYYINIKVRTIKDNKIKELKLNLGNQQTKIEELKNNITFYYRANETKVDKNIKLISLNERNHVLFGSIHDKKQTLIFYIPPNLCNECYKAEIKRLDSYKSYVGNDNLFVLFPLKQMRQYKKLFDENNIKKGVYAYKQNIFENIFRAPVYFLVDSNYQIKELFITGKNYDLSNKYVKIIHQKYFK